MADRFSASNVTAGTLYAIDTDQPIRWLDYKLTQRLGILDRLRLLIGHCIVVRIRFVGPPPKQAELTQIVSILSSTRIAIERPDVETRRELRKKTPRDTEPRGPLEEIRELLAKDETP